MANQNEPECSEIVSYLMENFKDLSMKDQLFVASKVIELGDNLKPIYDKYKSQEKLDEGFVFIGKYKFDIGGK